MPRNSTEPRSRLQTIELLLLWEGRVSRSRLLDFFPVHETQASRDIAAFRKAFPDACKLDSAAKCYRANPWMTPSLTDGVFAEYQALVATSLGHQPGLAGVPYESANLDATSIPPSRFSVLYEAIRAESAVAIEYRSLRNPAKHERLIRPHALIAAGPRWHIRAYCERAQGFRDFNLGRISAASTRSSTVLPGPADDTQWQCKTTFRLVPHQALTADQKRLVRDEYMGGTAALAFHVRVPMVRYLIHAFRAAIDPDAQRTPDHLLMVMDPEDLPDSARWDGT